MAVAVVPVDTEIYLLTKCILGCEGPFCPLSIKWKVKGGRGGSRKTINEGGFPVFLYKDWTMCITAEFHIALQLQNFKVFLYLKTIF